jgi:D-sedoheptulose 7-phosphate isomerase
MSSYSEAYLAEAKEIILQLDSNLIEQVVEQFVSLRARKGRLFILGVGGGAGHASHAVNDFRKIADIEAYAPTDNVSELTARVNDDGWETVFENWLRGSRLNKKDMVLVFSVGGGDIARNISPNLVCALDYSTQIGATIIGIVGRDGGHTAKVANISIIIPTVNTNTITPHTEAFQAVLWHLLVSHPKLRTEEMKWEQVKAAR